MKRALITLAFAILTFFYAAAQISDERVVALLRQYAERGASQSEIAADLLRKGVTQEQLVRIRGKMGQSSVRGTSTLDDERPSRLRTPPPQTREEREKREKREGSDRRTQPQGRDLRQSYDSREWESSGEREWREALRDSILAEERAAQRKKIFGHDVFAGKELSFEPSLNVATPDNYTLGPGDEVIVDIWGDAEQTIRQKLSPDGTIVVDHLGPVALNGFTVREAGARLRRSLGRIYSSMGGASPTTFVKLSLGEIRSIQVHVMGEVANPGTYTIPSLASLFHVLYLAGGVGDIGSLRAIGVSRGGERVAVVDVYSYLLKGHSDVDIALRDGDIVIVEPYANLVEVAGSVKRPMRYEMRERESLARLLDFAGGFTGDAYRDAVTVVRRSGPLREVHNVHKAEFEGFALADGDSVAVGGSIDRFRNKLEIRGAVFRPGLYAAGEQIPTVKHLIRRAEGFKGDAFTSRAVLTREKPDYTLEVLPVDAGAIMDGTAEDIALRNGDVLNIPSIFDLREEYTVRIEGAVRSPGEYPFAENLSIEDMIIESGGLLESASTVKVDVSRRIKNPSSIDESNVRAENFTFPVRDGLVAGEGTAFTLRPFDIVTVRTSPGYEIQKSVSIDGEVLFPGDYVLEGRQERLSDLVRKAGGTLSSAYLRGASLKRRLRDDEQTRMESALRLTTLGGPDSLSRENLNVAASYPVGIELDRAVADPGSDYDLVLAEGDRLYVPGYVGTVAISGAVLFPNTVSYREGMGLAYYIDQAGGYTHGARRGAKIIIYMNGTIARARSLRGAKIAPGCEIVVPLRSLRQGRMSAAEIMSMGSSTASIAAMIATIVNLIK